MSMMPISSLLLLPSRTKVKIQTHGYLLSSSWNGFALVIYWRDNKEVYVSNPTDFPDVNDSTLRVKEVQEPIVKASIIVPEGTYSINTLGTDATYSLLRIFWRNAGPVLLQTRRGHGSQIPRLWYRFFLSHHAHMHPSLERNRL